MRPIFGCPCLGQETQRRFRCSINGGSRHSDMCNDCSDVDNASKRTFYHTRCQPGGQKEWPFHIRIKHLIKRVFLDVHGWGKPEDTCVIDQYVNRAEPPFRFLRQSGCAFNIRKVRLDEIRVSSRLLDLLYDRMSALLVTPADDYSRAIARERFCDRSSDSGCGTGYQSCFS